MLATISFIISSVVLGIMSVWGVSDQVMSTGWIIAIGVVVSAFLFAE